MDGASTGTGSDGIKTQTSAAGRPPSPVLLRFRGRQESNGFEFNHQVESGGIIEYEFEEEAFVAHTLLGIREEQKRGFEPYNKSATQAGTTAKIFVEEEGRKIAARHSGTGFFDRYEKFVYFCRPPHPANISPTVLYRTTEQKKRRALPDVKEGMQQLQAQRRFALIDLPDDVIVTSIFSGFLNTFDVIRALIITCKRLKHLAKGAVKLLDLKNTRINNSDLGNLLKHFPNLRELDLSHCSNLTSGCGVHLKHLRVLQKLSIRNSGVGIAFLNSFPSKAMGNSSPPTSTCGQHLEVLDISSVEGGFVDFCGRICVTFPNLKVLKASNLRSYEAHSRAANTEKTIIEKLMPLSKLVQLVELDLSCNIMTVQELASAVVKLRRLKSLDLHGLPKLNASEIGKIAYCLPDLEVLNISFLDVPLDSLFQLTHCKKLTSLNLSYSPRVNSSVLKHLKNLPSLKMLSIAGCEGVTDTGLAHVSDMQGLEWLDCGKLSLVTEVGLLLLVKSLPNLQYLDVQFCDPIETTKLEACCRSKVSKKTEKTLQLLY